ncbi:FtsX-like permease family protein [Parafannyhessea umbonata]|uniref:FtsX-like permease family protein n=1 Tax=Parafannyhessea umbonata TaxID=604330 RepID=UPI0026F28A16|nr:ABC transporter permease [Parafannyhessea umbonata]MCI7219777.1 ABC transporter permease [Parafannyhessea umbonata]MDY4013999.1 ABC transporter permease [Parafannyhessea umbonata]
MYARIALGNVRRSIRDFGIYFLTLVLGVAVYYAFNSVTQQSAVLRLSGNMRTLVQELGTIIRGVSIFVAVLLAFLVLFGNRFLIRRRKREFAIYLTLGMDRRHVSGIVAMESLAVGAGALVVGLAVGVLLSQALLYATARLFNTHVTGFGLMFSGQACAYTVMSFAIIFLVVGALNVLEVSRFRLIDLMNADRKGEKSLVRNLPLSVALFVVSLALIGVAYHELRVNGMYAIDWRFNLATALVSVGTFLLFFSVSGFLLRLGQSARGFYLRGLNMFALRQLSSRVNSAWVSISIVCAALFLAITSTCGGFAIVSSINQSVSAITHYDVSVAMYSTAQTSHASNAGDVSGSGKEALLKASVPDWDSLVADSARIDLYQDPSMRLNLKMLRGDTGVELPDSFAKYTNGLDKVPIYVVSLSQYNATLALRGDKPATLKANEALVTTDMNNMVSFWQRVALKRESFDFLGTAMRLRARSTTMEYQNSVNTSVGTIVVPDTALESKRAQLEPLSSLLNVKTADSRAEARLYKEVVKAHQPGLLFAAGSKSTAKEEVVGLTAIVGYLALYIGFVLFVSCAAILAIQQLSDVAESAPRYRVLFDLGAERSMVNHAILAQIATYFLFPLVVALAHSYAALGVLGGVIKSLGVLDFLRPLGVTMAIVLVLYGGYFLLTYGMARGVIGEKARRRE